MKFHPPNPCARQTRFPVVSRVFGSFRGARQITRRFNRTPSSLPQVTWTRAARGWVTTRARWVPCAARRFSSWSAGDGSRRRRSCLGRVSRASGSCRRHPRAYVHRRRGLDCPSRSPCTCRWTSKTACASATSSSGCTTRSSITTVIRSSTRPWGPARACRRASAIRIHTGPGRDATATSPS